MKILLDARLYGLENAGLGRYVNNLVGKLAEIDKKNNYVILLRKKYYDSLILPENWKKVCVDQRHYSFAEQFVLPSIFKLENPDIVHFPHFNVPILYNGRFVVTIHDLLMHQQKGMDATTLSGPSYFIKRLGYGLVFKTAVKKSKVIFVPSEAIKEELIKEYDYSRDKTVVTYEGVDKKIQSGDHFNLQKPYFVFAGNAYPHKNLARLIQAMVILNKNSNVTVSLAIASARNNFTSRLENLIHTLKADKFVNLLGFVSDNELGSLLTGSVGFVFPSMSEGFGLPGLEAINVGTLLLASDIPVFKEIYMNHALYFNQLEAESIAKTMKDAMVLSGSARQKIIQDGQMFVKRYSWDKMARQTLQIYEETFKKANRTGIR